MLLAAHAEAQTPCLCRNFSEHSLEAAPAQPLHAGCRLFTLGSAPLLPVLLQEWAALTSLRKLELRGHSMLLVLPRFLADLPALRHLDVGCCRHLQLEGVGSLTRLEVLSLQVRATLRD